MIDFSIKEYEMLCFKAARGVGYSWGMAEEAGYAAGWLAKYNLINLVNFTDYLQHIQTRNINKLAPDYTSSPWKSPFGSLCPIVTGVFLSDYCLKIKWEQPINFAQIAHPPLLLPFIANANTITGQSFLINCDGFSAIVGSNYVELLDNSSQKEKPDVSLSVTTRPPHEDTSLAKRIMLNVHSANLLMSLAAKTYVPESDELKASGAGGEKVDEN